MAKLAVEKENPTRTAILDAAEEIVLKKGYSGTSIDEIIDKACITKGGFFYHFNSKTDLAKHLLIRFLKSDDKILAELFDHAYKLSEDPLQQLLIFIRLYSDLIADLPSTHPGCLVASFCYESEQFDDEIRQINADGAMAWRVRFEAQIDKILAHYKPRVEINKRALADMVSVFMEGGIVLSKLLDAKDLLPEQAEHLRNYIRLLFDPNVDKF